MTVTVEENIGTAEFSTDVNNALKNLLASVRTGDYNALLAIAFAVLALTFIVMLRIKQKSKRSH